MVKKTAKSFFPYFLKGRCSSSSVLRTRAPERTPNLPQGFFRSRLIKISRVTAKYASLRSILAAEIARAMSSRSLLLLVVLGFCLALSHAQLYYEFEGKQESIELTQLWSEGFWQKARYMLRSCWLTLRLRPILTRHLHLYRLRPSMEPSLGTDTVI